MRLACLALLLCWIAVAAAEGTAPPARYRLPWSEGLSFRFSQAPGGRITTHVAKADLQAVDIAMPEGTTVLAARAGVVEAVEAGQGASAEDEPLSFYGNFVRVRHADDTAATYAHLRFEGVAVQPGETVAEGQVLGASGATGDVTHPHLHFGVTRTALNEAGWREELPVPITFYLGVPPVTFQARTSVTATANYRTPAEVPRAASERRLVDLRPRPLEPGEEIIGWEMLAAWLAVGVAAMLWFWRFSRD